MCLMEYQNRVSCQAAATISTESHSRHLCAEVLFFFVILMWCGHPCISIVSRHCKGTSNEAPAPMLARTPCNLQDRASMKTLGILVVAGDFNNAVTLNVTRQQLSELQLPAQFSLEQLQTDEGRRRFQEGAEIAAATQANIFEFELLSSSMRAGENGRAYCDLEFTDSICRSQILEGIGGRRRCALCCPHDHLLRTSLVGLQ